MQLSRNILSATTAIWVKEISGQRYGLLNRVIHCFAQCNY